MTQTGVAAASPQSPVFTVGPTWRAIGFELTTEARANQVLEVASDKCTPVVGDMENGVFISTDRSGAVLVFDVVDGKISDIHEDFDSSSVVKSRWIELPCRFILADFLGQGAQSLGRACLALRSGLTNQPGRIREGSVAVAALAQRVELYETLSAYSQSETARVFATARTTPGETDQEPSVTPSAAAPTPRDLPVSAVVTPDDTLPTFISMGAISAVQNQGIHAGAVLAARIDSAQLHSNTLTGQNFWVLQTDVGFPLPICVGQTDLPARPRHGQVIAGEFLILGSYVPS